MSHYFIEDDSLEKKPISFKVSLFGKSFDFESGAGQFSYGEADPNSLLILRSLDIKNGEDIKMLDLGCGWGLIGIAAARVFGVNIVFSDINGNALSFAEKNARENGVSGIFIKSDGFLSIDEEFDLITLNPPIHAGRETVLRLFSESAAHLTPDGVFITVINEKHGAKSCEKSLREIFRTVDPEKHKKTYIYKCYGAKNAD
jgi:16S rRNA (guanine1207-N2)-methyltransferase